MLVLILTWCLELIEIYYSGFGEYFKSIYNFFDFPRFFFYHVFISEFNLSMNMFMNLFKFNLFKFCSWTCSWTCSNSTCSSFVQISSWNLNMFMNSSWTGRLVHEHVHKKKKLREKFELVHEPFMNTWTRDFLQLVHEQKFGFKTLYI